MATTISQILSASRNAIASSLQWFRGLVRSSGQPQQQARQSRSQRDMLQLHYMRYGPPIESTADRVPYWDIHPLVILLSRRTNQRGEAYITALNLHYLDPRVRSAAFKSIVEGQNANSRNFKQRVLDRIIRVAGRDPRRPVLRNYLVKHIQMMRPVPLEDTLRAEALYIPLFTHNLKR